MMKRLATLALAVALCGLAPIVAHATPVVINGSFETGDLTGWGGTATSDGFDLNPFGTTYGVGMDGTYWMWLAGYEVGRTVSQTVTGLSSGGTYSVRFLMSSEATHADQLNLSIDGGSATLFTTAPDPGNFWNLWTEKTLNFVASGSSATLLFSSFGLNSDGFDVGLDNVRVDELSASDVPEPATLLLLGTGLAFVAARRRFTRRS